MERKTMSKMRELREYIERKLMLAKLDSALLFFSSSLSIAFGVGYGWLGGKWLQYYLPMLLLGWFMPVYIGYVRGSLIEDSIEERVRGWIYFIMGLGYYIASPLFAVLAEEIFELSLYSNLVTAILSFIIGFLLSTTYSTVIYKIFKIQIKNLREEVRKAFSETRLSALLLAILLMFISTLDWSKFYKKPDLSRNIIETVMILILGIFFMFMIMGEKKARKLLQNARAYSV